MYTISARWYIYITNYLFFNKINRNIKVLFYFTGAFGNVKYAWLKKKPTAKFAIKAMKKVDIIQS